MSEEFDPYHIWLGIPAQDQPPNHYRLLGITLFEDNADVIDTAANRHSAYLHDVASGPNRKQSQQLLSEIAATRRCLLDPKRKAAYDAKLKAELAADEPEILEGEAFDDGGFDAELDEALDEVLEEDYQPGKPAEWQPPPRRKNRGKKKSAQSKPVMWPIWVGGGGLLIALIVLVVWLTKNGTAPVDGPNSEAVAEINPGTDPKVEPPAVSPASVPGDQKNKPSPNSKPTSTGTATPSVAKVTPSDQDVSPSPPPQTKKSDPSPKPASAKPKNVKSPNGKTKKKNAKPVSPPVRPRPPASSSADTSFVALKPIKLDAIDKVTRFEVLKDQSILAHTISSIQTYTITAETDVKTITAFKLVAMSDKALKSGGPGIGARGLFELAEFTVTAAPKTKGSQAQKVVFSNVAADFAFDSANNAIDGDDKTYWHVARQRGNTRVATFFLKEPLTLNGRTELTFTLKQKTGLGRFQLLVTSMTDEAKLRPVPVPQFPLFVNLGGADYTEPKTGHFYIRSMKYQKGSFGFEANAGSELINEDYDKDGANSCVEGIRSFRVDDVPNGPYIVELGFCECWAEEPGQRVFTVVVKGHKPEVVDLLVAAGRPRKLITPSYSVQVKDGVLNVDFVAKPGKRPPILNTIWIGNR